MEGNTLLMGFLVQQLRNAEAAGDLAINWYALWLNPAAYLQSIEWKDSGWMVTPPQMLAQSGPVATQDALFWQNWPCMQDEAGPDPLIYGSRDAKNRWCNWMDYGPLPIRVTEPSYMLTKSGHAVQLENPPYTCLFDGTDCTSEILPNQTPYTAPYGGPDASPAPVTPLPIQDLWMGRKTYRYLVPVPVLFNFEAQTPDGPMPIPAGYPYPPAYPAKMPGRIVGMHVLSQVEQVTFGYFDIPLPPIPFHPGDTEVGPPSSALYESYFPTVLRAWPVIRKLTQQYGSSIGFNLDKWVLACSTKDVGALIPDDPFPCVLQPFLDAFTSQGQVINGDGILKGLVSSWFDAHPEQGPAAQDGSYRKWKYENEFMPFIQAVSA
jgi:hypothetical protein